jgi:hypothetical protein
MNPKLKELRKRFQSSSFPPTPETSSGHDSQVSQKPWVFEQRLAANSAEPAEPRDALTPKSSSEVAPPAERVTDNRDGQIAPEETKSVEQLRQSIAKLFQPGQLCKKHLDEIANASDSMNKLVRSAPELFESLKSFCDHVPKLSKSFTSMRAFQDDLGVLAESFESGKALHQQVIQLAGAVRAGLTEVAVSLEIVNALRAQAAELAQTLEAGAEIQAQFDELAKAIGPAVQSEQMSEPRQVELWPCGYVTRCSAPECRQRATTILRYLDNQGRPDHQTDACDIHASALSGELRVIDRRGTAPDRSTAEGGSRPPHV